jgi:hypothetical protein
MNQAVRTPKFYENKSTTGRLWKVLNTVHFAAFLAVANGMALVAGHGDLRFVMAANGFIAIASAGIIKDALQKSKEEKELRRTADLFSDWQQKAKPAVKSGSKCEVLFLNR